MYTLYFCFVVVVAFLWGVLICKRWNFFNKIMIFMIFWKITISFFLQGFNKNRVQKWNLRDFSNVLMYFSMNKFLYLLFLVTSPTTPTTSSRYRPRGHTDHFTEKKNVFFKNYMGCFIHMCSVISTTTTGVLHQNFKNKSKWKKSRFLSFSWA